MLKKKIFIIGIIAALLVGLLCGCSASKPENDKPTEGTSIEETETKEKPTEKQKETEKETKKQSGKLDAELEFAGFIFPISSEWTREDESDEDEDVIYYYEGEDDATFIMYEVQHDITFDVTDETIQKQFESESVAMISGCTVEASELVKLGKNIDAYHLKLTGKLYGFDVLMDVYAFNGPNNEFLTLGFTSTDAAQKQELHDAFMESIQNFKLK